MGPETLQFSVRDMVPMFTDVQLKSIPVPLRNSKELQRLLQEIRKVRISSNLIDPKVQFQF